VRFRKAGYSPVVLLQQKTGVKDLVVVLDSKTYFEGLVTGPDGRPAPHASIRVNQGPKKLGPGRMVPGLWTETTSDERGRYRLYVFPDEYEFLVKAPGIGSARLAKSPIERGQHLKLDIQLEPVLQFRAITVDSQTGRPVPGVKLSNWILRDLAGQSNADGRLIIDDMIPGATSFTVEADGYTRWWSEQAMHAWERFEPQSQPGSKWQRNFDYLEFEVQAKTQPVTITLEKGVRITGQVLDPDGKPVGGATVAPAYTGTGNSLTGDTRFSVESKADGSFDMLLPASGKAKYNLVVHDGKFEEWRRWANGVLPPIQTTPGQEIKDVVIRLTRPATVRGRVVDANKRPVAGRAVRASAADKRENRYYDPTTTTKADGSFELKFVRAGEQYIQVAPFWLAAKDAPAQTTKTLKLKEGEKLDGVELIAAEEK
jgi:protocatechuate 3,4-dioxygenase beta subunit